MINVWQTLPWEGEGRNKLAIETPSVGFQVCFKQAIEQAFPFLLSPLSKTTFMLWLHENNLYERWLNDWTLVRIMSDNQDSEILEHFACGIHHFHIDHNTSCLPPKILHNHCFRFLLGRL